jgi:SAM-dependent methyltransferase
MAWKDLFSQKAADYARFRPTYPPELFAWLAALAPARELAVDVGAGNGQAAAVLAEHFARVIAVDPSAAQLANAPPHPRIEYRLGSAEATTVEHHAADLMIAAQAFHWFQQGPFFAEARRVLRPRGVLALWCYAVAEISPAVDEIVRELYVDYLDAYWEPERRLVEDGYRSVDVPFGEISTPAFDMRLRWSVEQLAGYLGTWSPLKRYIAEKGVDPLEAIVPKLIAAWGDAPEREVRWPLSVRAFRR